MCPPYRTSGIRSISAKNAFFWHPKYFGFWEGRLAFLLFFHRAGESLYINQRASIRTTDTKNTSDVLTSIKLSMKQVLILRASRIQRMQQTKSAIGIHLHWDSTFDWRVCQRKKLPIPSLDPPQSFALRNEEAIFTGLYRVNTANDSDISYIFFPERRFVCWIFPEFYCWLKQWSLNGKKNIRLESTVVIEVFRRAFNTWSLTVRYSGEHFACAIVHESITMYPMRILLVTC